VTESEGHKPDAHSESSAVPAPLAAQPLEYHTGQPDAPTAWLVRACAVASFALAIMSMMELASTLQRQGMSTFNDRWAWLIYIGRAVLDIVICISAWLILGLQERGRRMLMSTMVGNIIFQATLLIYTTTWFWGATVSSREKWSYAIFYLIYFGQSLILPALLWMILRQPFVKTLMIPTPVKVRSVL
jgi:hypothetical protein